MPTERYDKLVRDGIPAIITAAGGRPETRVADPIEFRALLRAKLVEEVQEFLDSGQPGELADVLEVIRALAADIGVSHEELEGLRKGKAEERGVFTERLVLSEVTTTDGADEAPAADEAVAPAV